MSVTKLDVSLEGYEIGLSGAIPERSLWTEPAMERGIMEFVSLFSGLVFKYGGRIVHGTHPALTPIILRQARLQASGRWRKPVTLVVSDLWARGFADEDIEAMTEIAEVVITKKVGDGNADDPDTRNRSLTAMRRVLIDSQNAMVLVGGKLHEGDGFRPGVSEEMDMARAKEIPRFLVAGLGGLAAELAKNVMPASLNNALSEDQNWALFSTNDVAASVNLIFSHFVQSVDLANSAIQPIKWNPGLGVVLDHRDGSLSPESTQNILRSFAAQA